MLSVHVRFWGLWFKINIARADFIHATAVSSNNSAEAVTILYYTGDRTDSNLSQNTILKKVARGFPYYLQVNAR